METKAELEKRIDNLNTVIERYKRDLADVEQQLEAYNQLATFIGFWKRIKSKWKVKCIEAFGCNGCPLQVQGELCLLNRCDTQCFKVEQLFLEAKSND